MAKSRRGRGEGSIEELPSGKWRAVLSNGLDPATGKRRKLTYTADTKKEAQVWLRERQGERDRGQLADAGKMTVGEWLDQWLAGRKPDIAGKTYDHDESRARLHLKPALGPVPLGKLTALHIEQLLAAMAEAGHSSSERFKVGSILRAALKAAVRLKLLASNVAADVRLPKVTRPEKVCLDANQAKELLGAARAHRLATLFDLALDAGMRPGELFALHWPDVDLDAGTVYVHQSLEERKGHLRLKETKTPKSKRRIRLARRTVDALRRHREWMRLEGRDVERGPVFCDTEGGFLRQSNFLRRVMRPILQRAGLPAIRPYDLRHTSATLLLSRDVNIRVVSERLGHESIELTLKHYAHALPDMQQRAADAVDDLFGAIVPPLSHSGEIGSEAIAVSLGIAS
jgi:integrase